MTGVSAPADRPTSRAEPARPRTRNRRGEGGLLRPQILTAAAELLDEHGSEEAVTLRAVARRAGIAAPSIYGHFADRQAILVAVVTEAFTELQQQLEGAGSSDDPVADLHAVCAAYLAFADSRPERYRAMFGGVWNAARAVDESAVTGAEAAAFGQDALAVIAGCLRACADAGRSTSTDPGADAVALWLGLHGLAHQRAVARAFPWPDDIVERIISPLAHLQDA